MCWTRRAFPAGKHGPLNGKATLLKKPSHVLEKNEYFCRTPNYRYAGTHLLLEFWGAKHLDDIKYIEGALARAVEACGATLLEMMVHRFSPSGGVSGIAVIKESHISIHTWPEFEYAALDVFTCGTVDPHMAVPVLREAFAPDRIQLTEQRRGMLL